MRSMILCHFYMKNANPFCIERAQLIAYIQLPNLLFSKMFNLVFFLFCVCAYRFGFEVIVKVSASLNISYFIQHFYMVLPSENSLSSKISKVRSIWYS